MSDEKRQDEQRREVALTLAVQATQHFSTTRKGTIEWAKIFDTYILTGEFKEP